MAKNKNNAVMHGMSGKINIVVFRQRNGETIASMIPKEIQGMSPKQETIRLTFKDAARYAKAVITDPALKLEYELRTKPGQTAYNLAIADFFKAPVIGEIDNTGYSGQTGSTIKVPVTDDFKVVSVKVKIENTDGTLVEEGDAILQNDGLHRTYTSTQTNSSLTGDIITVTAFDMPGHASIKQKTM
jgi:hypothetical protein